jgi:hypothetical protein
MQATENWLWSKGVNEIWLVTGNDPSLRAYGFIYIWIGFQWELNLMEISEER